MHKLGLLLICASILAAFGQTRTSKYERGTIMAVSPHQKADADPPGDVPRYDVSIKIGNVLYVVLFTPRNGVSSIEYAPGIDMLFFVGSKTLTFNSKISGTTEVPILRREILPAEKQTWSNARGEYFTMKQQHLSEVLGLTQDQQVQIKPALERETAEAGEILWNPMLSRKDKLKRYEKVVSSSDASIKPFLSANQVEKLQELRKEQKDDVKRVILEQNADKKN